MKENVKDPPPTPLFLFFYKPMFFFVFFTAYPNSMPFHYTLSLTRFHKIKTVQYSLGLSQVLFCIYEELNVLESIHFLSGK